MSSQYENLLRKSLMSKDKEKIRNTYELIYNDYAKLVSFCVAKYVDDKDMIKDITNDVFISFFNHASEVDESIKSYLCQMARNAALNYLKKESRLIYIDNSDDLVDENSYSSASFYSSLVSELNEVLTKDEVEIILLHAVEGYSFKYIGEKKHISANNANVIYYRTIKRFKKSSRGRNYEKR